MNILITNDDSIYADGLYVLIEAAKGLGNLYVLAPEEHQSGMSTALSVRKSLKLKEYKIDGVKEAYSVDGTPADAVRTSEAVFPRVKFDLVLSGVNKGANISSDIYHSGTIGAVFMGLILQIPGIAVSASYRNLELAKKYLKGLLKTVLEHKMYSIDYALSINFPEEMDELKVMFTHQGREKEMPVYTKKDGYLTPVYKRALSDVMTSDLYSYYNKMISITPIKYDKTDYETLNEFNELKVNFEASLLKHLNK
ncbi:MAG: 5'/3'-nucleotidase SurE [Acholeplasmatales bacterium]